MNAAEVRAIPEMNGFRGEFQKLDRAGWHAVQLNGVVQLFETEDQAQVAAYRAMIQYLFGGIVRSGETVPAARIAADKIFRPGRKPIEVERR